LQSALFLPDLKDMVSRAKLMNIDEMLQEALTKINEMTSEEFAAACRKYGHEPVPKKNELPLENDNN